MINKVILIGHVGKDPETKSIVSTTVTKLSLATTETWKKDGEKKEETQWHNLEAWGKLAEIIDRFVKKGDKIYVEGKIKYREHEGKYYTTINVDTMTMLGSKKESKPETDELFQCVI